MEKYIELNNGVKMPMVGFGVYQIPAALTERCVLDALSAGYRHIDTAQCYGNERAVGMAVKKSELDREDIFLTTKIWGSSGYRDTEQSISESLRLLQTDYIDLFLIHEPSGDFVEIYRAMEDAYKGGKLHAIGVANFLEDNYLRLIANCEIIPAVDQLETHVFRQQRDMQSLLREHGTLLTSWSPLACGQNNIFRNPVLMKIAEAHGKTVAQVALRWLVQRGIPVIPKSTHRERIRENFEILDFTLTDAEMSEIVTLDRGRSLFNWW
ncbi:MAG: aldo/keto reductase [Muribaculaceae bacterium]|nr:aldo/keto reductase [Muribaculaceae bacterium]